MMTQPNFRDVELLSAYLDGELSQAESARLETRLKTDPQLRTVFDDLSQSRALLRKLPARRAPRNFTLTPKMAGVKPPVPRVFPVFRFASALAAFLFFFSFAVNLTVPAFSAMRAAAPAPGFGRGGGSDEPAQAAAPAVPEAAMPAAAPTEALAAQEPSLLAPAPAVAAEDLALTPTPEAPRIMASAETTTPAPTELAPQSPPPQHKASPTEEPPTPMAYATPVTSQAAPQPLIPAFIMAGLFFLAVLAGAAAFFVRWQADRKFGK